MGSTVFLICGNTAAGKSTYAAKLAEETGGVRFSVDPWMQTLYGADYDPTKHDFGWLIERTERCKTQMRQIAGRLLCLGIDVILDFGFGDAASRADYRAWAASLGANASLHFLDVSAEERRTRVHRRNEEKSETFAFPVTDEMFDYVETLFIPPTDEELAGGVLIR